MFTAEGREADMSRGLGKRVPKMAVGILLVAAAILLSGCKARELEDREFVQAMEIDLQNGKLVGGFGGFLVEADTVEGLQKSYQDRIERFLDLGHVKVLVLGKDLIKEEEKLGQVMAELSQKLVLARNILVLSYNYEDGESYLNKLEEKGVVPGEYLSNLYKNNPYKKQKSTATLGDLMSYMASF